MAETLQSNIARVKVNELINLLLPVYMHGSMANNFTDTPAIMMWGPPGVGKSDCIKTLAKKLEENTGKIVMVRDVRLLLFNPVDLRGIPVPHVRERIINIAEYDSATHTRVDLSDKENEAIQAQHLDPALMAKIQEKFAVWLKPLIFQLNPSPDVINILLLDEISAAPPSVQAAAYQLVLNRMVGEHKLPDNTIILAAGNRLVDKGVAYKMPTPLANRMTHFEIYPEVEDWKEWAIPNGKDNRIIGFLNMRPNFLFKFDPASDDVAFCTPRSWDFVDKYLKIYGKIDSARTMVAGSIGMGPASEFASYCKVADTIPNVDDIMNGKQVAIPKGPDVLYALSAAITSKCIACNDDQLQNIARYTMAMPKEFSVLTMKDSLRVITPTGTVKSRLLTMPDWIKWAREHRLYIA